MPLCIDDVSMLERAARTSECLCVILAFCKRDADRNEDVLTLDKHLCGQLLFAHLVAGNNRVYSSIFCSYAEYVQCNIAEIVVNLNAASGHDWFSIVIPFDFQIQIILRFNASFKMCTLAFENFVGSLERSQKARFLHNLHFFFCSATESAGVLQFLDFLHSNSVITVEADIVFCDDCNSGRCGCLPKCIGCAACISSDVMNGHMLNGKRNISKVEEGCNS